LQKAYSDGRKLRFKKEAKLRKARAAKKTCEKQRLAEAEAQNDETKGEGRLRYAHEALNAYWTKNDPERTLERFKGCIADLCSIS